MTKGMRFRRVSRRAVATPYAAPANALPQASNDAGGEGARAIPVPADMGSVSTLRDGAAADRRDALMSAVLAALNEGWGQDASARRVLPLLADILQCETVALFTLRGGRGALASVFGPTRKRGYPYPGLDLKEPTLTALLTQPSQRLVSGGDVRSLPTALRAVGCRATRSVLIQSIFTGHILRGFLVASWRSRLESGATSLQVVPVIADALGLSLGGAVLSEASQARELVLESADAAAKGISGSLDLAETFHRIARAAAQATGDSRCLLLEADDASDDLVAVACSDDQGADLMGMHVVFEDEGDAGLLTHTRRIAVEDLQWGTALSSELRERLNLRSALVVPLRSERGALGALLLYSVGRRTTFTDDDVARAEAVAEQAAGAIRNAQLFRTLERSEQRSRLLLERISRLRAQQRLAVADTIHDDVLQTLVAALYELEAVAQDVDAEQSAALEQASLLMRTTIREARTIIRELRPPVIDGLGLTGALRALVDESLRGWPACVELGVEDVDDLEEPLVAAVYTIAREALQNARRHARAGAVTVTLRRESGDPCTPARVRLTVVDDGCGFDPSDQSGDHFGLKMMEEHAASLGGALRVDSRPGCGSTVEALLPFPMDRPEGVGNEET
jgi:signal transduction histidine kinase